MTIEIDGRVVSGERVGVPSQPVTTCLSGPLCAAAGCRTVVSAFNGGMPCAAHDLRVEMPR